MSASTVRSPGRPKDDRKRLALLQAARQLLLERGVEVTTGEVAAAAGVAKSTLYAHFKDKEELVEAVITHESSDVIADSVIAVAQAADFAAVISAFGQRYVRFVNQTDVAGWDRLIAQGTQRRPDLSRRFYDAGPGRWHGLLVRLLETGNRLGQLQVHDTEQAAEDLAALWQGTSSLQVKLGVAQPLDDAGIRAKVAHGLRIFQAFYGSA